MDKINGMRKAGHRGARPVYSRSRAVLPANFPVAEAAHARQKGDEPLAGAGGPLRARLLLQAHRLRKESPCRARGCSTPMASRCSTMRARWASRGRNLTMTCRRASRGSAMSALAASTCPLVPSRCRCSGSTRWTTSTRRQSSCAQMHRRRHSARLEGQAGKAVRQRSMETRWKQKLWAVRRRQVRERDVERLWQAGKVRVQLGARAIRRATHTARTARCSAARATACRSSSTR